MKLGDHSTKVNYNQISQLGSPNGDHIHLIEVTAKMEVKYTVNM